MNTAKLKAAAERANAAMNDYVGGVIDAAEFQRLAAEFRSLTDSPDQILMLISALEAAEKEAKQWKEVVEAFCADDADWHKLATSNNELISQLSLVLCKQTDRIAELEARTVTMPRPACTYADHSYPAYSEQQVVELLESLGINLETGG